MFSFLSLEKDEFMILAIISGGITAALLSQKAWKELGIILFSGISIGVFTVPAICEILNWTFSTTVFSNLSAIMAIGYLFALGGNVLALKVMAWWKELTLYQFISYLLQQKGKKPSNGNRDN